MLLAWLFLVAFSVWFGLLTFFWALQDGQFSDQERARYLPLADAIERPAADHPEWRGMEKYVFLCIGLAVVFIFGAALYLSAKPFGAAG